MDVSLGIVFLSIFCCQKKEVVVTETTPWWQEILKCAQYFAFWISWGLTFFFMYGTKKKCCCNFSLHLKEIEKKDNGIAMILYNYLLHKDYHLQWVCLFYFYFITFLFILFLMNSASIFSFLFLKKSRVLEA